MKDLFPLGDPLGDRVERRARIDRARDRHAERRRAPEATARRKSNLRLDRDRRVTPARAQEEREGLAEIGELARAFATESASSASFALIAYVTVALGGFGSVTGALVAGLLIGVFESLSAYLIGPVYKDVVVYCIFVLVLWFRPQGLMGKM